MAKADRKTAWEFLEHLLKAVPYRIHTILTERAIDGAIGSSPMAGGIQFAEQPRNRNTAYSRQMRVGMICEANEIEQRLTKPNHPWSCEERQTVRGTVCPSGGQVERMNRTIKEATVKRFHYGNLDPLRTHLAGFMAACDFGRSLKTLNASHALRIHLQDMGF